MFQAKKKIAALAAPLSLAAGLVLLPIQNVVAQPEYLSDSQEENVTNSYEECWEVSYGLKNCGEPPAPPVAETITIYNHGLSERRAQAAADYLAGQGVDASKMSVRGEGELNPAYSNDTRDGRAKNRRVEISVN